MGLAQARAGALKSLIIIERAVEVQDASGQPIATWVRFSREWAAVESTDTRERFQGTRDIGYKLKRFTIRYRSGVSFKHRIKYKDEYYNIRSISEMEKKGRDKFLEILAEVIDE